jgi:hypothetical protein
MRFLREKKMEKKGRSTKKISRAKADRVLPGLLFLKFFRAVRAKANPLKKTLVCEEVRRNPWCVNHKLLFQVVGV